VNTFSLSLSFHLFFLFWLPPPPPCISHQPWDPIAARRNYSVAVAVDAFLRAGADPSKLFVGAAFYGRGFHVPKNSTTPVVRNITGKARPTFPPGLFFKADGPTSIGKLQLNIFRERLEKFLGI
jgi:hypothetical protein